MHPPVTLLGGFVQEVLDALPLVVWMATDDGATCYVNCKDLGRRSAMSDSISNWDWLSLVHPDEAPRVRQALREAMESGHAFEAVVRLLDTTGQYRRHWVHYAAIGHKLANLGWIGTALDIEQRGASDIGIFGVGNVVADVTERKRTEEASPLFDETFRELADQARSGIFLIQGGRFAYANAHLAHIFGYASAAELAMIAPLALVHAGERASLTKRVRRDCHPGQAAIDIKFRGLRKDGAAIDIGGRVRYAQNNGRRALAGIVQDISEKTRKEEETQRHILKLKSALMCSVEVAMNLERLRDPYTAGHSERVAALAVAIGRELAIETDRLDGLEIAARLHDIGKMSVPAEILAKPAKLTNAEFALVKGHALAGYEVLKHIEFPWPVAQMVLQHHERMDGSGYPQGLKGEAILFEARILAVADVVEAMVSHRPYRTALGLAAAIAELERGRGTTFDAAVADACLNLIRDGRFTFLP